jgi:copper chaperone CopZ
MMHKTFLPLIFGVSLILTSTSCFRNDTRTVTYDVPALTSRSCSDSLQNALSMIDGVISAEANLEQATLTVTFDGLKLGIKNVEYVILGAGFDVNGNPGVASAKAELPPECR